MQINVYGNSATATKLQSARKINLDGTIKGMGNFDGSTDITINTTPNNIKVVSGKINIVNATGSVDIEYPQGFNSNNTIPLTVALQLVTNGWYYMNHSGMIDFSVRLFQDHITVFASDGGTLQSGGTLGEKNFKLILMKI